MSSKKEDRQEASLSYCPEKTLACLEARISELEEALSVEKSASERAMTLMKTSATLFRETAEKLAAERELTDDLVAAVLAYDGGCIRLVDDDVADALEAIAKTRT